MRRQINKQVLLRKVEPRKVQRATVQAHHCSSPGSMYETILAHGGNCRVCVIRKVGGIGDVLMITPALQQLKKDFKNLHLTFAIDMHTTSNNVYYELMKNCPFVDKLIDARYVQHGSYDAVTDISAVCIRFERKELPAINRVDLFGRALGLQRMQDRRSWYRVEPDERQWAQLQYRSARDAGKKIVFLHTASMEDKRCWPVEKYLEIVRKAEGELPVQFAVMDFNNKHNDWAQHKNVLNVSGTTLRQMAALIAEADLFIGPDSGPMHIAGAVATSSLVVFGSVPPQSRINYYPTHEGITLSGLPCLGCWYKPCTIGVKCMVDLSAMLVYSKMKKRLGV